MVTESWGGLVADGVTEEGRRAVGHHVQARAHVCGSEAWVRAQASAWGEDGGRWILAATVVRARRGKEEARERGRDEAEEEKAWTHFLNLSKNVGSDRPTFLMLSSSTGTV